MGASMSNFGRYSELTTDSLQQEITIKKIPENKLPPKLKRFSKLKFKDKRRKSITVHNIPLGAAGEIRQIPLGNLMEMNDPHNAEQRHSFTDCALTDPTSSPGLERRKKSLFQNGIILQLKLATELGVDGHELSKEEKEELLKPFVIQFAKPLILLNKWRKKKRIQLLKNITSSAYAGWVQGNSIVKHFPPISQLTEGQLPESLKLVSSEDIGNVIIDRESWIVIAIRIHTIENNQHVVLPDEMVHVIYRDSGLERHERFYGRSIMEPFVQLSKINKHTVNYQYAKAISAAIFPKVAIHTPVEGDPEEKDEQLKKRAAEWAEEGVDVIAMEANELSKVESIDNKTNNEMVRDIRKDIDEILMAGMGTTKLKLGRTEGLNRDTATIMEVENIRDVRTPDELEIAEFFEEQLLNPLFYHLTKLNDDTSPVRIQIKRIDPEDETTIQGAFEKQDGKQKEEPTQDNMLQEKGAELETPIIPQKDATTTLGASGLKQEHFYFDENLPLGAAGEEISFEQTTNQSPNISIINPAGSSFVGKVTYTPALQSMEINLNGNLYGYCNVPQRIFDGFSSAGSKGEYYNRSIKGQYNC